MMKHLILSAFTMLVACCSFSNVAAQNCSDPNACNYNPASDGGVLNAPCLLIETVAVHETGDLDGLTTYRVYFQAESSTDFVTSVFGNEATPLTLTTTTDFYQNALGGASAQAQNPLLFGNFPELIYDSYVTIGLSETASAVDGESNPTLVPSPSQDWIAAFDPGSGVAGTDIIINDLVGGIWYIFNGDANGFPDENNRVLLAQLTTDGVLGGTLNVQYFPNGGEAATATLSLENACQFTPEDCTYPELYEDCLGDCLNDADEDQVCDEVDDCVGTVDAIGECNGSCAEDVNENGICDDAEECIGSPALSAASPSSGLSCMGGALVSLSGLNLCDATVSVDGGAVSVSSSTATEVNFTMPEGSGSVEVTATTSAGTSNALTLNYGAPALNAASPSSGLSCLGGELVVLVGMNLCDATVTVDGEAATVSSSTATQVNFTMPVGSGSAEVTATSPSGTSNALTLSYGICDDAEECDGSPALSAASPSSGLSCMGGALVSLSGSNLCDATVSVDGGAVSVSSSTATEVNFTMPEGSGSVEVTATTSAGTSNALTLNYGAPALNAASPSSGLSCLGGELVVLVGMNLCDATVTVDGEAATVSSSTATQVNFTMPVGSGSAEVTVTSPSGTSNALTISYGAEGCIDPQACNFDGSAVCDGGGCLYEDAVGVCDGDCPADADGDGVCDNVDDCIGAVDACGICNGPGAIYDCGCDEQPADDCDCNGNQLDALGVCGGDCPADADQNGICDNLEGSGCGDPAACNFDEFADPIVDEPVTEYCAITEVVATHTSGDLSGMTTYRVYVQTLNATDFVTSVSGNIQIPLDVSTTTTFYQNPLGGVTPENVNPLLLPNFPDLAYDSWVTIGIDGPANATAGESAASVVTSPNQNWTLQFEPGFGAPGGSIEIDDEVGGVWYILNGDANGYPDADGRVLLGQFTTDGDLSGTLNVQLFPEGDNTDFLLLTLPIGMGVGCPTGGGNENCLYEDALGSCGGDCEADADGDDICDDIDDCVGTLDACNVCNGPGAIYDCGCTAFPAGDCDCDGNQLDALGVCGGDCAADADNDGICDNVDDCVGELDECGICNGPGATGDCGCDELPDGACDCDGNVLDALDVCGGDCAADADGDGVCDNVDDCIGAVDACGICNGPGAIYDCGCDEQPADDCDCNGNQLDALGVCGGDCPADADQNGICDNLEGSGCGDPAACNFDEYADPIVDEPVTEYCAITEVVATHSSGDLSGMTTYRVYVQTLNATDFVTSVSGNIQTPLDVSTTTTFYQNPLGGVTPENVNPLLLPNFPDLAYDSWVTIGIDGPANATAGESAASVVTSPNQNWTLQFEPGFGAPGGSIEIDDEVGGVWYILNGDANGYPDADGRVLLGQFTTDGDLSGTLNVQLFPEGDNTDFLLLTLPIGMGVGCPTGGGNENCLYEDALGSCGGDCEADADGDDICDDIDDCVGTLDACNVCNGPGAIYDCGCTAFPAGDCDCDGNQLDALGVCGGDCAADADNDGICDNVDDCVGELDECGICNGPGATGDCGCDELPDGACDCDGNVLDALDVCGGDCAADADGDGVCDNVDDCIGAVDACGICNGPGAIYDCGCDEQPADDCDCNGNQLDALGVCGGDCPADADQNGICDNLEGSGCGDPAACNFDEYADPIVDEPVTEYCAITEVVATHTSGDLNGMTTYRVYVQTLNATDFVTSVSGNIQTPLDVSTTTTFYQNPLGGVTPENVNPLLLPNFPDLAYDSWVTIGIDGPANATAGESAASVVTSPNQNWTLQFEPGFGAPGGSIEIDDEVGGVWYILNGDANGYPDADGRVLLGQFTTNGDLSGTLNVQVFPEGDNTDFLLLTLPIGMGVGCPSGGGNENCLYEDVLGNCGGDCEADVDGDGICDNSEIPGCTLETACNYNPAATDDDGSCATVDECGECGGNGIADGDCDCDGNQLDALGVCGGDCAADADNDGICDNVDDCVGALDACGVCNGPGAIYDCGCDEQPADDCDCDGNQLDALGVCGGDCAADADNDGICDNVDSCVGALDACGVCNGPGAIYDCGCDEQPADDCDCDGNQLDALGVCGGDCAADADNDGICDNVDSCVGALDDCGVCNGPGAIYDCGCDEQPADDCDCNGNQLDALGVCGGDCEADADNDGICDNVDSCVGALDACGVCNGPGAIYDCGCDEQPADDCDCNGNQLDALGVCGGDCPADVDGDGVCDNAEVPGCTLETACNFNPLATDDDGTCQVLDAIDNCGGDCPADLNGDGICDTDNVFGCTEPSACNFNPDADVNNGSCDFFTCLGCTDSDAVNFDSTATIDDGGCLFSGCTNPNASNYDGSADVDDGSCLFPGCTDISACNYSAQANDEDNSCDFSCYGCTNQTACNYDSDATVNDGSCEFNSCRGCTNPDAINYDADATIDDNSCLFDGCTNPEAENYDPNADINDGSCIFGGCTDATACNYNAQANQDDGSCDFSCYGCINSSACNYDPDASVNDGSCEFNSCRGCTDSDAINFDSTATVDDGSCLFTGCTDSTADNYDANADFNDGSCQFSGCTNPAACNFDIEANVDDGTCDVISCYGCMNPAACNYDETAEFPDGSCDLVSCRGCTDEEAINYDSDATIDNGSCLFTGCTDPAASNYDANADYSDGSCIYSGCTNPFACNFDDDATVDDGTCDLTSCYGCINPLACNYDSTATLSDGSCDLFSCRGCTNPDAVNYNPDATIDNGSCIVVGCLDPEAENYNPDADYNDPDLCTYPVISGCLVTIACNYNPDATVSDGNCDYASCAGCTDPAANNYDATATLNDGSCSYGMIVAGQSMLEGCTLPFACNFGDTENPCEFDSCAGCLVVGACNYDPDATLATTCFYPEDLCNGATNVDCDCNCLNDANLNGICDENETGGCTNPISCNYDPAAAFDDGSCDTTSCGGCTDPSSCNYDDTALLNDGSCDYNSCTGCLDSTACNYDETATVSDGSCTYPQDFQDCDGNCLNDVNENNICDELEAEGCTNPFACNFNANATFDDGSCESTSCAGCTDNVACNYDQDAVINDGNCDYTSCVGCTDDAACNYDAAATISSGECTYPLNEYLDCNGDCLQDANQNGLCDPLELGGCTNADACNYDANANVDDGSCDLTSCQGCLDAAACNYDGSATQSDGSCEYASCQGCIDASACNYSAGATQDDGSCVYPSGLLLDCDGNCINDIDEDGVCDELEVAGCDDASACNYTALATDNDGSCDYASCTGCLDASACNYDAGATQSSGNCDFESCVGCTAPNACNYDPTATQGDASCIYPDGLLLGCDGQCINDADGDGVCDEQEAFGCDQVGACNYNALATENDGSCDFVSCQGCTVPSACNYNPNATQNDGSCDLSGCLGCTYQDALNYDATATEDNGSCLFDTTGGGDDTCPGDFTDDGVIGIADLLEFLIVFDSVCAE